MTEFHRNWQADSPEEKGRYYFSGTAKLNVGVSLSFEPQSILVDVWHEADEWTVYFGGIKYKLTSFQGRWLGPVTEEQIAEWKAKGMV